MRQKDQAAKKVDKYKTSLIGWGHIMRVIEVLDMTMKDLI